MAKMSKQEALMAVIKRASDEIRLTNYSEYKDSILRSLDDAIDDIFSEDELTAEHINYSVNDAVELAEDELAQDTPLNRTCARRTGTAPLSSSSTRATNSKLLEEKSAPDFWRYAMATPIYDWSYYQRKLEEKARHQRRLERIREEERMAWIAFACICAGLVLFTLIGVVL